MVLQTSGLNYWTGRHDRDGDPIPVPGEPVGIAAGPDGNMWFTEYDTNKIGTITTAGVVTESRGFRLPYGSGQSITIGADGHLWAGRDPGPKASPSTPANLDRISPTGSYRVLTADLANHQGWPSALSAGPDGAIWSTNWQNGSIGRLQVHGFDHTGNALAINDQFTPPSSRVDLGTALHWTLLGPKNSTITDASGLGLFDSGPRSFVSYYDAVFSAAGTYRYANTRGTGFGRVRVPVQVSPAAGPATATFDVRWATAPPAGQRLFGVQVRRPGSTTFVDWQIGVRATHAGFVPDAGPGQYAFRAHTHDPSVNRSTDWSPPATATVS